MNNRCPLHDCGVSSCLLTSGGIALWAAGPWHVSGLGGGPPIWLEAALYSLVIGSILAASFVHWRGWTPDVTGLITCVGLYSITLGWVLGAFSAGRPRGVEIAMLVMLVGGMLVAGIGITTLDVGDLWRVISAHRDVVCMLIVVGIVAELAFGVLSPVLWMFPVVWASGVGIVLVPLVVLGGCRLLATTGIRLTTGICISNSPRVAWNPQDMVHIEGRPRIGRATFIIIATVGVTLVLLAPDAPIPITESVFESCSPTWGGPAYSVDWNTEQIAWNDGCRDRSATVNRGYAIGGGVLALAGVIGE